MNMNDTVRIVCENTGRSLFVNRGTSLLQIAEILSLGEREDRPFLAAYVNNRLKELDFAVYSPVSIRYIDITHFEGMRVYQRTLFFVLQKAVYDLFPGRKLHIKHSVAKGFYCEIEGMEDLSDEQIVRIKERMRAIVAQDLPIVRQKVTSAEAEAMYEALGLDDKIALLRTRPHLYVTVYSMADLVGYFYGALAVSTGYVSRFDLHPYYKGFRMALPQRTDPTKLEELVPQDKMFEVFSEYTRWVDVIGVANIGSLNARILEGGGSDLIRIAEALHEKALGNLADRIYKRHRDGGARIVLISGPSSSGKTTFAKRLGIQLSILGMRPVLVSLDDYFVDREKTPLDEDGEYDYEALEAIDVGRFNDDLAALLLQELGNLFVRHGVCHHFLVGKVGVHQHRAAHLAVDLHRDVHLGILALFLGIGRPALIRDGIVMSQQLPDLLAHVRRDAGKHLDEVMITLQHGVLHRKQTLANGGEYCDYFITGDKERP